MFTLQGRSMTYAWGSATAIPSMLGEQPPGGPVAELWFGAHPSAPAGIEGPDAPDLLSLVHQDPGAMLGSQVRSRFGDTLPYLLKIIAPDKPLSLQVHPDRSQAQKGFDREEQAGTPMDSPARLYPDANHKPELIYALTTFRALSGFRTPRRAGELVSGLGAPLARRLERILALDPTSDGVRAAITVLLTPGAVEPEEVDEVVMACSRRRGAAGGSVRVDRIVVELGHAYPGDPGVVAALLLNPVTLQPGEAMFVPAGSPHAYLHGLGVEIMANSDNVLRAGLTSKHVDTTELLRVVDCQAAPPVRIAAEIIGSTRIFYAPVEDFQLALTQVRGEVEPLEGQGPRILLGIEGEVDLRARSGQQTLRPGRAVFVPARAGVIQAGGRGTVVQASVP